MQRSLRMTNFVFRKPKGHFELEINTFTPKQITSFNSLRNTQNEFNFPKKSKSTRQPKLRIQNTNEEACTNFMKNYLEKLKAEKKKQTKKMQENRSVPAKRKSNILPFMKMNTHTIKNQILFNTKQSRKETQSSKSQKGELDSLEIVLPSSIRATEPPDWANPDKINQLIQDIRESRKPILEQNRFETERKESFSFTSQRLQQQLRKTQLFRSKLNNKGKKKSFDCKINLKNLQPWKGDSMGFQFSIEQYTKTTL